jgi:hypothetical protein
MRAVVDTNVILVANRQHKDVSDACIISCISELISLMGKGKIVIDDAFGIIEEYCRKTQPNTGNRPGDIFVKWVLQNKSNIEHCEQVTIGKNNKKTGGFFPSDYDLADFDVADRKFVETSLAHPKKPPIFQAADTRWLEWSTKLKRHGVEVKFLCLKDIQGFRKANKS